MTDSKTTENKLWEVHEALIDHFLEILRNDEPRASTLNVIRAFLKDNAITRNEMKKTNSLEDILENWSEEIMPDYDGDDTDNEVSIKNKPKFKFAQ